MSQEALAEQAGISINTMSRIEDGQTAMSVETFRKLVQILGVDANEALGIECPPLEAGTALKCLSLRVRFLET